MKALAAIECQTLGTTQLAAAVEAARAPWRALLHGPRVVLTFDDAYEGLASHAFPTLADHMMRAIVFVVTDFAGKLNSWDVGYGWRRFRHLTWAQLGKWQELGMEVESHGATHRRLTWLSDAEVADELGRSRETITKELGRAPVAISYPFGAVDARVSRLAADAGYRLGFAGPLAAVRADPLVLHRRPVYAWDVFAPPLVLGYGPVSAAAVSVAQLASRFSVVTSAIKSPRKA